MTRLTLFAGCPGDWHNGDSGITFANHSPDTVHNQFFEMADHKQFVDMFDSKGVTGVYNAIARSRRLRNAFFVLLCSDIILLSLLIDDMLFLDLQDRTNLIAWMPVSVARAAVEFILRKYRRNVYTKNPTGKFPLFVLSSSTPRVFYCLLAGGKVSLNLHVVDPSLSRMTYKLTCELGQLIGYSCQSCSLQDILLLFVGIEHVVYSVVDKLGICTWTNSVYWTIGGLYCGKVDEQCESFTLTKYPFTIGSHDTSSSVAAKIQTILCVSRRVPLFSAAAMKHVIRFYTGQIPTVFRKPIV